MYSQNEPRLIKGIVLDEKQHPIEFATVILNEGDGTKLTDKAGAFSFSISPLPDSLLLNISFTGKQARRLALKSKDFDSVIIVVLQNQSLALDEVQVTGVVKNKNSASSIIFDEETIRQLQAFSLMDVLNSLPGRKTEAPNLQNPQTITFRTSADGADAMNNSFGIAIFIDGVRINNETDMQSRSLSSRGLGGATIASGDVTYNGFDLRDMPMSNIASIEVIQGVGSARYGDFTNGAILITTKAGKTPFSFNSNFNGGSSSFNLAKGLSLGGRGGALNLSLGYVNSNDDPRDKVKTYNNINASLKWTKSFGNAIINSFSLNGETNLDEKKEDPDDDSKRTNYAKTRNIRLSNSTTFKFKSSVFDNVSVLLNYATGIQHSYTQWLLNGMARGIGGKDTTGVYEGYFVPGNYLAIEEIEGKPVSYSGNIDLQSKSLKLGGTQHHLSFGISVNGSGNRGRGSLFDPNKPRWTDLKYQNERPFNYADSVRFTNNVAAYFQDNIKGELWGRGFNLGLGFRFNSQNGRGNAQPRLSFNYKLTPAISTSTSYGISFKSPSLAHLYPSPAYFDIPLLNLYSGYESSSLYLVYTEKVPAENRNLKQAVSYQFEQGVSVNIPRVGTMNLFGYFKKNKNGFNSYNEFIPLSLPVYDYHLNPDNSISYFPTGAYGMFWDASRTRMNNGLQSEDYGLQFSLQTRPVRIISTSFGLQGAYAESKYTGGNLFAYERASQGAQQKGAVYVEYQREQRVSKKPMFNLSSTTQIPKIGFVVSVIADYEFLVNSRWEAANIYPFSFISNTQTLRELTKEESRSDAFAYLRKQKADEEMPVFPPKGFWNLNMRVAKEIKRNIRLSISAFNVFNAKPQIYIVSKSDGANSVATYNIKPVSVTIGASLQF